MPKTITALLAGAGLAVYGTSTNPRRWTWTLSLWAGIIGAMGSAFTLLQVSVTSQVAPVTAAWGVRLALAASIIGAASRCRTVGR